MVVAMTPPQTPRRNPTSTSMPYPSISTPPQSSWQLGPIKPVNDSLDSSEQLLRALDRGSMHDIRQVLDADPDAAWMPVELDGLETPICAAIQLHCDLEVFKLLITRGAKLSMVNCHGQGPLSVLASCRCVSALDSSDDPSHDSSDKRHEGFNVPAFDPWCSPERKSNRRCNHESEYKEMEDWILPVAVELLQAGCSITEKDSSGRTSKKMALDNGWPKLAFLIQEWHDFRSCVILKRWASKSQTDDNLGLFRRLPDKCVCHLLGFVAATPTPARLITPTRVD